MPKPKPRQEEIEVTVYDEPSDKYPEIGSIGLTRARQTTMRALLGTLRAANAEAKQAARKADEAYKAVVETLERYGINVGTGSENAVRFWCDIPWTIYRGSNTHVDASALLSLGVSAELIQQATKTQPHSKITIKAVEKKS